MVDRNEAPESGQNRYLVLRFYLLLAAGLIAIAALLDYGFDYYEARTGDAGDPWLMHTLAIVEAELPLKNGASAAEYEKALSGYATRLSKQTGIGIRIYTADRMANPVAAGQLQAGVTDNGDEVFLYAVESGLIIELTASSAPLAWRWSKLIPVLFYAAIFIVVGLWFAPLVRDLNRLGNSATTFARDYRKPLPELRDVTHLTDLAGSMDAMTTRIRGLISTQQDLTNALSHEIRTPLARMKFALAVAEDGAPVSNHSSDLAQDIGEIDALVSAMLDYARLEQRENAIVAEAVSIPAILREFTQSSTEDVTVECTEAASASMQQQELPPVYCDPYLLNLALSNLVVNASRHARSIVQLGWVLEEPCWAVIRVDDDGAGVPSADREVVFAPFRRLASTAGSATGGFGLGLAIVARIAQMHGGTACVVDSPLGGARFELRLRLAGAK